VTALDEIIHLADVEVTVEAELDRRNMSVSEILAVGEGTVLKMSRAAGENIEILIGGARIGSAEIVIIEDAVGVRITDFNEE
jgi:flagellar motor switch protein FliN/FliY